MSNKIFRKQKPIFHFLFGNDSVGGFVVDFYMIENKPKECYVHMHGKSCGGGIFEMKLNGYTYGYLMESARQGKTENIHGFCAMLYLIATGVYQDQAFADELMKAVIGYQDRLFAKAEESAKSVTQWQEVASQAVMEDIISERGLSRRELKAKRESDIRLMREILRGNEGVDIE